MFRRSADVLAAACLVLLIVVLYADILFLGRGLYAFGVEDLLGYHIPMKWVVRDIVEHGAFPYWNRFFSAGQPLAANPAYHVFYPLNWLILLPSFHFGFQLHILVHFVIAALGMYLLVRGLGGSPRAAAFGAAVFVVSGPYLSVATKLPMLFSLSWMPLALECARRAIVAPSRRRFAIAAIVLALELIIAEPMVIAQTWMFIIGYLIWLRHGRRAVAIAAGLTAAAALVAAVQLIPAADFARDSVRSAGFSYEDVTDWSLPAPRLLELGFPSLFRRLTNGAGAPAITTMYRGRTEPFLGELYVGVFVALLAISGILSNARGSGTALIALSISALLALGEHTPLYKILYAAHLIRSMRYPEKFLAGGVVVLLVWAALMFDRMLDGDRRLLRTMTLLASVWLAITAVIVLSATDRSYFGQQLLRAAIVLVLVFFVRNARFVTPAAFAVIGLSVADGWWATRYVVPRMPREFFDAPPIARQLPPHARVYPEAFWQFLDNDPQSSAWIRNVSNDTYWWMLRNSLVDHLPARYGFEVVLEGDIDRTALKTTDDFREAMRSLVVNHAVAAEEPFLKMSGAGAKITYRAADENPTAQTTPVDAVARMYPKYRFADRIVRAQNASDLLANLDLERGLSNVAFADIEPFTPARGDVVRANETPNTIALDVRASGPAFLIVSATAHRYWSATIDGSAATLIPTDITYQGIRVPAGTHHIEMRYRNPWILPGAIVSLLALAALAFTASGGGMPHRASSRA